MKWIALYQNPAGWLAQQRLTGEQYSVLFALFSRLDFENYLRIGLKEIAEFLNMQPANVSRAMRKLKELEIIIEGPPAGKFKTYRLNPYVAHKGSEVYDTVIDFNDRIGEKIEMNWIALHQNAAIWLTQQDLTGEQFKVLFVIFGKLDFENYLRVSRQEIADIVGIQPTRVSRAMKKLKELEIIIEGSREGKFKTYRLNPYVAHKGSKIDDTVIDFNAALEKKSK